jgi:hypothetical protein
MVAAKVACAVTHTVRHASMLLVLRLSGGRKVSQEKCSAVEDIKLSMLVMEDP